MHKIFFGTQKNVAGNEPNWPTHLTCPKNFFQTSLNEPIFCHKEKFLTLTQK